jgi:hypothetical protein
MESPSPEQRAYDEGLRSIVYQQEEQARHDAAKRACDRLAREKKVNLWLDGVDHITANPWQGITPCGQSPKTTGGKS